MHEPFVIDRFGGLNVADDPTTVGPEGGTSVFNVDLDLTGRVRARAGYSLVRSITLDTTGGLAAYETTAGVSQFVVGYSLAGVRTYAAHASTGGAAVATAAPGAIAVNSARWGDPTNEYLYIANGVDTIWRWTGAAFSQPAGMPTAKFLTVSPSSNRLVTACLTGLTSRVLFSDAGAPETFTYDTAPTPDTGSYVDLTPGDGSPITGLTSYKTDVYAFKKDRFFVFTGESTSATGKPIFNYRPVDGYGALAPPVTGDEGVFFFDGRSIWVTTGGAPTRVSRAIEPILRGVTAPGGLGGIDQTQLASVRLFYSLGRLYVRIPSSSAGIVYTLVYDPKIDAWTLYFTATPMDWMITLRTAGADQKFTYFFGFVGAAAVNKFDPALTLDAGNIFSWVWQGGLTDAGEPGRVKVVRESRLWGVGTVTLTSSSDYGAGLGSPGSPLVLGTSPTVRDAWDQSDFEGTTWQITLVGTGWGGVDRVAQFISHIKPAGLE